MMPRHEAETLDPRWQGLAAACAGLAPFAGIQVKPGENCSYNFAERTITLPPDVIDSHGELAALGIAAHEAGHAWISHLNGLPLAGLRQGAMCNLVNAVEDPRVNTFMRAHWPGTRRWFNALGARAPAHGLFSVPRFLQFCLVSAAGDFIGWDLSRYADKVSECVFSALTKTNAARRRFAETFPSPAAARVNGSGAGGAYSAWEAVSWAHAAQAVRGLQRDVVPVACELIALDVRQVAADFDRNPDLFTAAGKTRHPGHLVAECFKKKPDNVNLIDGDKQQPVSLQAMMLAEVVYDDALRNTHEGQNLKGLMQALDLPAELLLRLLDQLLIDLAGSEEGDGDANGSLEGRAARPSAGRGSPAKSWLRAPRSQKVSSEVKCDSDVDEARQEIPRIVGPQVLRLAADIEEILLPRKHPNRVSGFPSGQSVDLRRVMKLETDPLAYRQIWQRRQAPDRQDFCFSLLVDLSGSMSGEKVKAAVAGTVLLARTLQRLACRFAINGFQDQLIPFVEFGAVCGPKAEETLYEMILEAKTQRPDGNNCPHNDDGPCLLDAAAQLLQQQATDHALFVISDGAPAGIRSGPEELHAAVDALKRDTPDLHLFGIGLGEGTEHVLEYYPNAIASVPPEKLAAETGALIKDVILGRKVG